MKFSISALTSFVLSFALMAMVAGWLPIPVGPILLGSFFVFGLITCLIPRCLRGRQEPLLGLGLWLGVALALAASHHFLDLSDPLAKYPNFVVPKMNEFGQLKVDGIQLMSTPESAASLGEVAVMEYWGLGSQSRSGDRFLRAVFRNEEGLRTRIIFEISYDRVNPNPNIYSRLVKGSRLTQGDKVIVSVGDSWKAVLLLVEAMNNAESPSLSEKDLGHLTLLFSSKSEVLLFEGQDSLEAITLAQHEMLPDEFQQWSPLLSVDQITIGNTIDTVRSLLKNSESQTIREAAAGDEKLLVSRDTRVVFQALENQVVKSVEGQVLYLDGEAVATVGEAPPEELPGLKRTREVASDSVTDSYTEYGRRVTIISVSNQVREIVLQDSGQANPKSQRR